MKMRTKPTFKVLAGQQENLTTRMLEWRITCRPVTEEVFQVLLGREGIER
jgi:hypothetical protein